MNDWDFGRAADGHRDASRPASASCPPLPPSLPGRAGSDVWSSPGDWQPQATTADEDWPDDEWGDMTPYPLTYERDDFVADRPEARYERDDFVTRPQEPEAARPAVEPGARAARDLGVPGDATTAWAYDGAVPAKRGRWLIPAGLAVAGAAAGAAAVLLTGGQPAAPVGQQNVAAGARSASRAPRQTAMARTPASTAMPPAAAPAAALTMTQAKAVLAGYTSANNTANARRSDALLASVESGSSYAIDAGLYQGQQASDAAPFPAFGPAQATYYIPRGEPAGGPRWFVAQVANAFASAPDRVTSQEYLLFTQPAPGDPWQQTLEPYLLPGVSAPRVTVGADGLATTVGPDSASLAVAPSQLPAATAASLDGPGSGAGQAGVADPGNLADRAGARHWQAKVPGAAVTDAVTPAAGSDGAEFALRTDGGGALVFYTDAAEVTVTAPAGSALHLNVPGFYSPGQALARAGLSYLEQFAAYDPPTGSGAPRVVADYSGITAAG